MNGGYAKLMSLNKHEGRELVREADTQHICWVGPEPWATQTIVENAFVQPRTNKAHSAVQKQPYSRPTQHQIARIRVLHQRVTPAETERLAKVCNTLQTHIFNWVQLPQSSYEDFPLANGLIFGKDK
jgi:hypothetical protein